jgi:hypothetical protein
MSIPIYNITDIEKAPVCKLGELGISDMFAYCDNYTGIIEFYIIINVVKVYGYECVNLLTGEAIWFSGVDDVKRVKEYSLDFGKRYR